MSNQAQANPFFTPIQISGCQLWLDAADTRTFTLSGASRTTVSSWNNKVPGGITTTTVSAPSLSGKYLNNIQTFRFNSNSITATLSSAVGTGDYALFAVWLTINGGTEGVLSIGPNGGPAAGIGYNGSYYNLYEWGQTESQYVAGKNQYVVQSGTRISSRKTVFYNGNAATSASGALNLTNTNLFIGNGTGFSINGEIGEILMYQGTLTTLQRQQIEGYLAWKWGLQTNLPSTHPYKTSPIAPLLNPPTTLPVLLPASFQPQQISGLSLWLDASDTTTITGASPITGWTDKSGTGKTITFVGANNTYNSTTQSVNTSNGSGATSTYFYANLNLKRSVVPNVSVFMAYTWTGNGINENQPLWGQDNGGGWNRFQLLSFPTTPSIAYGLSYVPASPFATVASALNTGNKLVYTATYAFNAANGTFVNVNGTLASSLVTEVPASPETSTTNTYFGTIDTGYSGRVAFHEILIYTANLSVAQRQQVEGYLAWKWNLTSSFSSTFPYRTIPPSLAALPVTIYPRSVATASSWNPLQISGCQIWLDASDLSSFTFSGSSVTQWNDKSGNGYNASGGVSPLFLNNGVFFNGSSYLSTSYTAAPTAESIFIVTKSPQTSGNGALLGTSSGSANGTRSFRVRYLSGQLFVYWDAYGLNNSIGTYTTVATNTTFLGTGIFSGTSPTSSVNGNPLSAPASFSFSGTGTTQIGRISLNFEWYTGTIYEIVIYNIALSTAQRQNVEGYLAWKWGFAASLPTNHPFKLWPPSP